MLPSTLTIAARAPRRSRARRRRSRRAISVYSRVSRAMGVIRVVSPLPSFAPFLTLGLISFSSRNYSQVRPAQMQMHIRQIPPPNSARRTGAQPPSEPNINSNIHIHPLPPRRAAAAAARRRLHTRLPAAERPVHVPHIRPLRDARVQLPAPLIPVPLVVVFVFVVAVVVVGSAPPVGCTGFHSPIPRTRC